MDFLFIVILILAITINTNQQDQYIQDVNLNQEYVINLEKDGQNKFIFDFNKTFLPDKDLQIILKQRSKYNSAIIINIFIGNEIIRTCNLNEENICFLPHSLINKQDNYYVLIESASNLQFNMYLYYNINNEIGINEEFILNFQDKQQQELMIHVPVDNVQKFIFFIESSINQTNPYKIQINELQLQVQTVFHAELISDQINYLIIDCDTPQQLYIRVQQLSDQHDIRVGQIYFDIIEKNTIFYNIDLLNNVQIYEDYFQNFPNNIIYNIDIYNYNESGMVELSYSDGQNFIHEIQKNFNVIQFTPQKVKKNDILQLKFSDQDSQFIYKFKTNYTIQKIQSDSLQLFNMYEFLIKLIIYLFSSIFFIFLLVVVYQKCRKLYLDKKFRQQQDFKVFKELPEIQQQQYDENIVIKYFGKKNNQKINIETEKDESK